MTWTHTDVDKCFFKWILLIIDPVQDKTYNKTCVTNKDSDQPVRPHSMAMNFFYPSLDSQETAEGTCDQKVSDQNVCLFVCVEVLWPSQPNGVMSSAVILPSNKFTGKA